MTISVLEKGASSEIIKDLGKIDEKAVSAWIYVKNILSGSCEILSYEDVKPWHRSGGETYSSVFKIMYKNEKMVQEEKLVNLKAIVSIPVEKSLDDWRRRREILAYGGVPVSTWYASGSGIIIEEFYPLTAYDVKDLSKLIEIAQNIDKLGFSCSNFVRDILCDKNGNPFYVDFGFDLGEPKLTSNHQSEDLIFKLIKQKKFRSNL